MNTEDLGNSRFINLIFKPAGMVMKSRLRHRIYNPVKTLQGAGIQAGQTVLEAGCGTGFFTIPAARLIGKEGSLVAIDALSDYVDKVLTQVREANLTNVNVVKGDALDTKLPAESIDTALLFGVIPFPSLPLNRLLPEMHRILKPEGRLAVWLFPVSFGVPRSLLRSGLFTSPVWVIHLYKQTKRRLQLQTMLSHKGNGELFLFCQHVTKGQIVKSYSLTKYFVDSA
jgi:demethylmenaquinone methyltransferase/2-methoxy-6-polyprenyl-1,4-benzoquinol methylase